MKTQEEMMAYFASMPKKTKQNPYWRFNGEHIHGTGTDPRQRTEAVTVRDSLELMSVVRHYFRNVFESFGTEAQVLCVTAEDAKLLETAYIPRISNMLWPFCGLPVAIFVLPQYNSPVNSCISEKFWQKEIMDKGIIPVVRIHSHHKLDAYQSSTDYSTLNSNTLEMVMGHIPEEKFQVAFWLDEHGKDTKSIVFQENQTGDGHFDIQKISSGKEFLVRSDSRWES